MSPSPLGRARKAPSERHLSEPAAAAPPPAAASTATAAETSAPAIRVAASANRVGPGKTRKSPYIPTNVADQLIALTAATHRAAHQPRDHITTAPLSAHDVA